MTQPERARLIRRYLDRHRRIGEEPHLIKALALADDDVGVANAVVQAFGSLEMRIGFERPSIDLAIQRKDRCDRLVIDHTAKELRNFFEATVKLMNVMARVFGRNRLGGFERRELTTWRKEITELTGVEYAGVGRRE